MLLTTRALTKTYGTHTILDTISFVVNAGDRIGIVGANGCGKSTLLQLLIGQEEADSGTIAYAPSAQYGYLPQTTPDFYGHTIQDLILASIGDLKQLEEQMHRLEHTMSHAEAEQLASLMEEYSSIATRFQDHGGYDIDYKIDLIMQGLRIDYLPRARALETLSGGENARVRLATLLLRFPDILLLDEPTNHLDKTSLEWLEYYLTSYRGALLIVSHDRQFLNQTVNHIFEIDEYDHHLKTYVGNYDAYIVEKQAERKRWEEEYERQQEEIKALRLHIRDATRRVGHTNRTPRDNDKFARYFFQQNVQSAVTRNIRAAQVQLERIEDNPIAKPPELLQTSAHFTTEPIQAQQIIRIEHLSKSFGTRKIIDDLTLTIPAHQHILLTGPNGVGKTTLFKLLMGSYEPDQGIIQIAEGARIGYLGQEPAPLDGNQTVIETYRYGQIGYEGEQIGRLLGYGLFKLADMEKKVGYLSMGQLRKLEIARLLAQHPNVLLLDEPTNYISLDVLEAFEEMILSFPGPVLVISHDRWLIQRFVGEIWEFADGHVIQYQY